MHKNNAELRKLHLDRHTHEGFQGVVTIFSTPPSLKHYHKIPSSDEPWVRTSL